MNNKGFSLIETVILSTSVILILMACYYPYKSMINDYNSKKNYDSIENIYKLNNVRNYIYRHGEFNKILDKKGSNSIISIKNLNFNDTDITEKYKKLLQTLNIEYIYVSNYKYDATSYPNAPGIQDYIDSLEKLNYTNTFRLIAIFKEPNNKYSYANIKIWRET